MSRKTVMLIDCSDMSADIRIAQLSEDNILLLKENSSDHGAIDLIECEEDLTNAWEDAWILGREQGLNLPIEIHATVSAVSY